MNHRVNIYWYTQTYVKKLLFKLIYRLITIARASAKYLRRKTYINKKKIYDFY